MSKLNDSTLKILKKYRLDTDMSVFGNENKLYDVVKVMDDMVGNQVGTHIGNAYYADSLTTQSTSYCSFRIDKQFEYAPKQIEYTENNIANHQFVFDMISYKYLYDNIVGNKILIGRVNKVNSSGAFILTLGYLAYDKSDRMLKIFTDLSLITEINYTFTQNQYFFVEPFVCYSDERCSFSFRPNQSVEYENIFQLCQALLNDNISSQSFNWNTRIIDTIILPDIINFSPYYFSINYYKPWSSTKKYNSVEV